ncbi:MAG: Nif3-like dinuclear metal center hexameric protein [Gammaproteobacteria bacterium]|nr:Nif3-like dinuclear metal center hexameric protein [Gammaproteobacteria bacterium]
MIHLNELLQYTNTLLESDTFQDYCPNGLQVEGKDVIRKLVTGVTASQALIDAAVEQGADALLVHHGYFWKGEDPCIRGLKGRRIRTLVQNDISLLAYHLPLDAHSELGNNAGLASALGLEVEGRFTPADIGMYGSIGNTLDGPSLVQRIAKALGREPQYIPAGEHAIRRIGWCSGSAQGYIEAAADLGLDAYISGEISEQTVHLARERGIHYFAAGHHATERFGVQALGEHLARQFDLQHVFIDVPNPV